MALQSGVTILNKYRIVKLLGEGGMARVWLAEELTFDGRQVALKEPKSDVQGEDAADLQRRFQQEISLTAALMQARAPNIVPAWTVEPLDGGRVLVMKYMPGGSLDDLLKRPEHAAGLHIERAVAIALDVLGALEALHCLPFQPIHCDVKPSNILFDEEGWAFLSDFRLAQLPGISGREQFAAGSHPGTPIYAAPEQLRNLEMLSPSADVFALGCVLWETLTGQRYKRYRPSMLPSQLCVDVPTSLDHVVMKALAEDPWERWQSAGEMANALKTGITTLTPLSLAQTTLLIEGANLFDRTNTWFLETALTDAFGLRIQTAQIVLSDDSPYSIRAIFRLPDDIAKSVANKVEFGTLDVTSICQKLNAVRYEITVVDSKGAVLITRQRAFKVFDVQESPQWSEPYLRRLVQLVDIIHKHLELLKDYENALFLESDPRLRRKYRCEIEQLKESIASYHREYQQGLSQVITMPPQSTPVITTQLQEINRRLQQILIGQATLGGELFDLRKIVVACFSHNEQTIVAAVAERLEQSQLHTVKQVLDAIEGQVISEANSPDILAAVQNMLEEIRGANMFASDPVLTDGIRHVSNVISAPTMDFKHKLKIAVPIIPMIITYEGEVDLRSGLDLEVAWKNLVARVRGTNS